MHILKYKYFKVDVHKNDKFLYNTYPIRIIVLSFNYKHLLQILIRIILSLVLLLLRILILIEIVLFSVQLNLGDLHV